MRKTIAAIILDYAEFCRKHRFIGLLLSLVIIAACAGGLYLIAISFPSVIPCLTGSGCVE